MHIRVRTWWCYSVIKGRRNGHLDDGLASGVAAGVVGMCDVKFYKMADTSVW